MQILKNLKIKNFLGTKSREINFDLYQDPLFIIWENAWGKTTIMRAIYFALTGEDAFFKNKNLDGLINDHAESMYIELELFNKWNLYKIEISKTRKKALNIVIYENWNLLTQSSKYKEAKEILEKLFWNAQSILSTYFIFGDGQSDFVENTPTWRLQVITKVSNAFEDYEKLSQAAKNFIRTLEVEKNQKIGQLEMIDSNLIELEDKIKWFNKETIEKQISIQEKELNELEDIFNRKKQIKEIEDELKLLSNVDIKKEVQKLKENKENVAFNKTIKEKIKKLSKEKENLMKELSEKKVKFAETKGELNKINNEIKTNESFIVNFNEEQLKLLKKYWKFSLEETKEKINNWEKKLEEIIETGRNIKTKIDILNSDIKKINEEITKKEKEINDTNELFKHNTECPLCHSTLKQESLENYKKFIINEVENLKKEIYKKEKEINELSEKRKIELTNYEKYKVILEELKEVLTLKEKDNKNKEIENKIKLLKENLTNISKNIENIEKEVKSVEDKVNKIEENIEKEEKNLKPELSNEEIQEIERIIDLNKKSSVLEENKIKLLSKIDEKYKSIDLNTIWTKINELKTDINKLKSEIINFENNQKRFEEEKKKKEKTKSEIDLIDKDIQQYEDIMKLYWKDGIQKKQIQMLLWQIEIETNALVKKFFDNLSVKFSYQKKGIDLKIMRRMDHNDGWFELKEDVLGNFSDAQQEILKVLLKVSFSKVVQNLNNTPLNVLFLNETFNTLSKDKEHLLVEILDFYKRYYHICFITHNQDLIWNFSNDNVYDINKE